VIGEARRLRLLPLAVLDWSSNHLGFAVPDGTSIPASGTATGDPFGTYHPRLWRKLHGDSSTQAL
jgi:hypothetical protein